MFRRRRSADVGRGWPSEPEDGQELADDEFDDEAYDEPAGQGGSEELRGPWDSGQAFPLRDRVDLGSLQVPMGPEHEIQLVMADQHGAWVTIRHGESEMQVQAFAAARRGALWDDVRGEIVKEVREAGGDSQEIQGSFGTELIARVPSAEHEYMEFVAEHPGWETEPFESAFTGDYGRFDSLADLFRQIGHDERVHKQESLAQAAASRFR